MTARYNARSMKSRRLTQNRWNRQSRFASASSASFAWSVVVLLAAASACAPKIVPVPTVTTPRFPDFIQPEIPASFTGSPVATTQTRGWTFLQAGDLKSAEREFSLALKTALEFYPAEDGLGYVALANKDPKSALPHFERSLEQQTTDVSAMVGR